MQNFEIVRMMINQIFDLADLVVVRGLLLGLAIVGAYALLRK